MGMQQNPNTKSMEGELACGIFNCSQTIVSVWFRLRFGLCATRTKLIPILDVIFMY
jgi:hypothetical protein